MDERGSTSGDSKMGWMSERMPSHEQMKTGKKEEKNKSIFRFSELQYVSDSTERVFTRPGKPGKFSLGKVHNSSEVVEFHQIKTSY